MLPTLQVGELPCNLWGGAKEGTSPKRRPSESPCLGPR